MWIKWDRIYSCWIRYVVKGEMGYILVTATSYLVGYRGETRHYEESD